MIRPIALSLLLATSACGGFDTGLNPRPDVGKEQGPLVAPPAAVVRGRPDPGAGLPQPGSAYSPSRGGAGAASRRCVPQANGLGADCQPL